MQTHGARHGGISQSVLDAIGDTPMLEIEGIYCKLEYLNPSGSIKARIAKYMIERAEREGLLSKGDTIVEATSGNTGNALCPGPVNTPLLQELFAKDPEKAERRLVHLPMGRFAEATEIANGALFLASDESSYVTASTFLVDGGLSGAYVTPE